MASTATSLGPGRSPGRSARRARRPLAPARSGRPRRRRTRRRAAGGTSRCPNRRAARNAPSPHREARGLAWAPTGRTGCRRRPPRCRRPSAISIPIVNVMPCTAVMRGLRSRRPRPNGSTGSDACSSFRRAASRRASSLKNSGISSPAVVWSPANVRTPTNRSGSSSSRVKRVTQLGRDLRRERVLLLDAIDGHHKDVLVDHLGPHLAVGMPLDAPFGVDSMMEPNRTGVCSVVQPRALQPRPAANC